MSFGVICVVTENSITHAEDLYNFFHGLGCQSAAFNIVEEEGVNKNLLFDKNEDTTRFWAELLAAWLENPSIEVREFRKATVWLQSEVHDKQSTSVVKDILPSIGYDGNVVLVSPEFLGIKPVSRYETFVVGNILNTSLSTIITKGLESAYINDFVNGMEACQKECEFFGYCRGGDASNKFFELGRLDATETSYCRNTRKSLINAVLQGIQ